MTAKPPIQDKERILAVLVLYNPGPDGSPALNSLCQALVPSGLSNEVQLFIYDNSPIRSELPDGIPVPFTAVHNPSNGGLFAAYDAALKMAGQGGQEWLMLLDQDTVIDENYLNAVRRTLPQVARQRECAALVPQLISNGKKVSPARVLRWGRMKFITKPGRSDGETTALNSGAVLRCSAIQQIGGFNPQFWLDYLDHWMFNRLCQAGFSLYVLDAVLTHSLSVRNTGTMNPTRYENILAAEGAFYTCCKSRLENRMYALRLLLSAVRKVFHSDHRRFCLLMLRHAIRRGRTNGVERP